MKFNSKEAKLYFSSDLHFSHKNILKFNSETRRGKDHYEMNELLIEGWNKTVNNEDHVFLLGDVSFAKEAETWNLLHRLNGKIHLIRGNHDHNILKSSPLKCQFVEVLDYKEIIVDSIKVCMMHYPLIEWNGSHRGSYMLHGHCHGRFKTEGRIMDVGIDARSDDKMIPFTWDEIHSELSSRPIIARYGD